MSSAVLVALLGLVQGLTEFLPVSSSGHLVLAQQLLQDQLDLGDDALIFDLVLHVATLVPVVVLYRREIVDIVRGIFGRAPLAPAETGLRDSNEARRLAGIVIVASIPTAIIGLLLEDWLAQLFHSPAAVGAALMATGCVLFATRWAPRSTRQVADVGVGIALLLGVVQGLAVTPGVSRSGATIAAALFLGLDRRLAARLSFLMALPAIAGAALLKARHGVHIAALGPLDLVLGMVVAAGSGYLALRWLVKLVRTGDFSRFAWYLWPIGALAIVLGLRG